MGAKADLSIIDISSPLVGAGTPGPEPLNNLLYANGLAARHVMTQGRFQIFDGQLVVDDQAAVTQRGARAVRQLWDQLRTEGWFT